MSVVIIGVIVSLMFSFSMLFTMHYLYEEDFSKKSIVDFLVLAVSYYLLIQIDAMVHIKELLLLIESVILLIFNHHKKKYESVLFVFVVLFKVCLYYPIDVILDMSHLTLLKQLSLQYNEMVGYSVYIFGNMIMFIIYYVGSVFLRKATDIKRSRLKTAYYVYSIFGFIVLMILTGLMDYMSFVMVTSYQGFHTTSVFYLTLGFVVIPFLSLYMLSHIYIEDLKMELLEEELESIMETKQLMYRYTHNINSLLLTVNLLLKDHNKFKILRYLENYKK